MKYLFESERLGFRPWNSDDVDRFFSICSDPVVMEFFPAMLSRDECSRSIRRFNRHILQYGYGFFAVDIKDTGEWIGFIGFKNQDFPASFTPCVEIGWRLKQTAWGHGFATEGARSCLDRAYSDYKIKKIYSFTPEQNKRSERVMQRIGMKLVGTFHHPVLPSDSPLLNHVLYAIDLPA